MNLVTEAVERLQKYEFASIEEARQVFSIYFRLYDNGPDWCAQVGFGQDGFRNDEGLRLTLPGKFTWIMKYGQRFNLAEGLDVSGLPESYHSFFDEYANILPLKRVAIDMYNRSVDGTITFKFDQATHVLFMQPMLGKNHKIPRSLKKHAVLNIKRQINPDYCIQYLVLPVAYYSWLTTEPEMLHNHRRFLYLKHLNECFKTQVEAVEEQNLQTAPPTEPPSPPAEKDPAQFRHLWGMDYGERVGGDQQFLHYESADGLEVNYVILPDGKVLAPDEAENVNFAEAELAVCETWKGIPQKAALVKYYAACWGQIKVYDFLKHPEGGEYTDRMIFALGRLQEKIKPYHEKEWSEQLRLPMWNTDIKCVKSYHTETWTDQIKAMREEAERAAKEAAQAAEAAQRAEVVEQNEASGQGTISEQGEMPNQDKTSERTDQPDQVSVETAIGGDGQTEFRQFAQEFGKDLDNDD